MINRKIDKSLCMGLRDGEQLFSGRLCQQPATHNTFLGRRCSQCAEKLRVSLRKSNTVLHAYTEEEINRMVVELQ